MTKPAGRVPSRKDHVASASRSAPFQKRSAVRKAKASRIKVPPIEVMISSRCRDRFPRSDGEPLSVHRERLKAALEAIRISGHPMFRVWINEVASATGEDSWDECMKRVEQCDLLIVLFTGHAGWTRDAGGVGICHAEFSRAYANAPGKVRLIMLGSDEDVASHASRADRAFQDEIRRSNLFRSAAENADELDAIVGDIVAHSTSALVKAGSREGRRGRYYLGDALDWSKKDFRARAELIKASLADSLLKSGARSVGADLVVLGIEGSDLLLNVHAVPAAFTTGAAREMLGRPFLRDHEFAKHLDRAAGPLHVIGCHRTATEAQAAALLGFPDATIVSGPFGVYVADDVQKIQFVLLANCRDDTMTRLGLQRFLDWLEQAQEGPRIVGRARSRALIARLIAAQADG